MAEKKKIVKAVVKKKTTKKQDVKLGRPTLKSPELLDEICARIMSGLNIVQVCLSDDMPHRDTVHSWLANDDTFSDKYARACRIRREGKFYEMEVVARTEFDVQRARLINDTLKWQLSKEEPKKYGDKLEVENNVKHNLADKSEAELDKLVQDYLKGITGGKTS